MSSQREPRRVSFYEATRVDQLDANTYRVELHPDFSIGAVPNGGYVGSCLIEAGSVHLSAYGQTDLLTAHFEYLAQTIAEPAIIVIEDIKPGRRLTTLHLTLYQGGLLPHAPWITPRLSRRASVAYATYTNMRTLSGLTQITSFETSPAAIPPALPDFQSLKLNGSDALWQVSKFPKASESWRSIMRWNYYVPRMRSSTSEGLDMWIRSVSGENITSSALAFVADSFPYNLHAFLISSSASQDERTQLDNKRPTMWFPTLVMNLDIKSMLPSEGVEWLSARIVSKQVKDGVYDLDITIRTVDGALVALSHHVARVVSMEKNAGITKKNTSPKAFI